jgi:DNA-binding transcriptional ArsR family regulator
MTHPDGSLNLLFPCECVSAREENYSDPWSPISRNRLFSDGTKEDILNLIADGPKTISQIAKALELSPPSVHKHINELLASELIRDSIEWEKLHPKERYYEPNFPVVDHDKCSAMEEICGEISAELVRLFREARPRFERAFETTGLAESGWSLDDLSQCLFANIQRTARRTLEEVGGVKPVEPHRNGVSWSFWAEKLSSNGNDPTGD